VKGGFKKKDKKGREGAKDFSSSRTFPSRKLAGEGNFKERLKKES